MSSSGRRGKRRRKRGRNAQAQESKPVQTAPATATALVAEEEPADGGVAVEELVAEEVPASTNEAEAVEVTTDEKALPDCDELIEEATCDSVESMPSETDTNQLAELTCEIVEKDELISALTQQLEDAAERLDRLHRAGADRSPMSKSSMSFKLPSPDSTSALSSGLDENVGQLVQAWEDLDAVNWMREFDRKLEELTSLVSQSSVTESRTRPAADPVADSWMGRLEDNETNGAEDPAPGRLAAWEEMKAQLMQNGDGRTGEDNASFGPIPEQQDESLEAGPPPAWDLEAPQAVDLENADRDELVVAVEERDEFITHLIRRIHSTPTGRPEPVDWATLNNAPDELREHLQELESRLEEVLRMEECDLSLERARLARERARLEQMRGEVDRQGGLGMTAGRSIESEASRSERRWLRVFGFGRKAGESLMGDDEDLYNQD